MTSFDQNSGNNERSALGASLGVDLQAPINQIVGMAEILANTDLDGEQRTFVSMISRSARALSSTVSDMIDLSQLDEGRLETLLAPFDLSELLDELDIIFAAQAQEKSLSFKVDIQPDLPVQCMGDRKRLRQVLSYFLSQALKFTERGAIGFRVSGQPSEGHVALSFSIDSHSGSASSGDDTIITALIALMGGKVEKEVGPNKSITTKFELSLPVMAQYDQPLTNLEHLQGVRVLFLASDTDENKAIVQSLNKRGLDACLVADIAVANIFMQAADKISTHIDVVLSELALLQNYLKSASLDDALAIYAKSRMIQIASQSDLDNTDFAALDGYARCLIEPIDHDDVVVAISEALKLSQAEPELMITGPLSAEDSTDEAESPRMIIAPPSLAPSEDKLSAPFDDLDAGLMNFDAVSFEMDIKPRSQPIEPPAAMPEPESEPESAQAMDDGPQSEDATETPFVSHVDVLIAEDNEINQLVYSQILSKMDVTFQVVDSANVFLKEFEALHPRLVLLDISLPDANGFDVAHSLRNSGLSWGVNVPMIGVVTPGEGQDYEACIEAGMDDCLPKPISPNTLMEKIEYWLERSANQSVA